MLDKIGSVRLARLFPSGMRVFGMYVQLIFFLKRHLAVLAFEGLVFLILLLE
jgi:hypothetical protein